MSINVSRHVGSLDYAANTRKTMFIDRDGPCTQLNLGLTCTITNGGTGPAGLQFGGIAALIARVEITMGGRDTTINLTGAQLAALARLDFGTKLYGDPTTVDATGSAATTYKVVIPVPFWSPRGRRPDDTLLDLRKVREATLSVTWANGINAIWTTLNSAALSAVSLDVEAEYFLPADNAENLAMGPYLVRQLDSIQKQVTGTASEFSVQVDGNTGLLMRSLTMITTDAGVADDAVLNNARLESGSFVFANRKELSILGGNKLASGLESVQDGVYQLRMLKFGEMTQLINTAALAAPLMLITDVTVGSGTTNLDVIRESWRPLKAAA